MGNKPLINSEVCCMALQHTNDPNDLKDGNDFNMTYNRLLSPDNDCFNYNHRPSILNKISKSRKNKRYKKIGNNIILSKRSVRKIICGMQREYIGYTKSLSTKLIFNYYYTYQSVFSSVYKSSCIVLSNNGLCVTGSRSVRLKESLPKGKASIFEYNIYNKRLSDVDYFFYGITSNENKPKIFDHHSGHYPCKGTFKNIYGICAGKDYIIYGSNKRAMTGWFNKPELKDEQKYRLTVIFDQTNYLFILMTFFLNGKIISEHNKNYTFKINVGINDHERNLLWYPMLSQNNKPGYGCKISFPGL